MRPPKGELNWRKLRGLWRDETTPAYLRRIIGRWNVPLDAQKLLDNRYDFTGERKDLQIIYENNFEADTSQNIDLQNIINGKHSLFVEATHPMSTRYKIPPLSINGKKWLRATATFRATTREWTDWKMPALVVDFQKDGASVKDFVLRPHRLLEHDGEQKMLWLDAKIPTKPFDQIIFWLQSPDSNHKILMDDVKIEVFND